MRIAHVANFYGPTSGGLRTAMNALGQGYCARGHEVMLVVPGPYDDEEYIAAGHRVSIGSPVIPLSGGYRVITRGDDVRAQLEAFRPDVIEVSDRTSLLWVGPWARHHGIPTVFFAHERADGVVASHLGRPLAHVVRPAIDAHSRAVHRRFDAVVATTAYAAGEFSRAGLETHTVPLGVDLEAFHPRNRNTSQRSLYARPHEFLVVMASRLSREKRPDIAIDAIRLLRDRDVPVRLVSAGTGAWEAAMRRRARGLSVEFLGFVKDRHHFASLIASADVVVAPGPIETFGLAALEALASGTPVVVNASSALPSVVADAGVAAPGTPQGFAQAITSVLDVNPVVRRVTARERAEQFPWSRTVTLMEDLHRRIGVVAGAVRQPQVIARELQPARS